MDQFVAWIEETQKKADAIDQGSAPQMSRSLKAVIMLVNGMVEASFATVQELGWQQLFAKFDVRDPHPRILTHDHTDPNSTNPHH